MPSLWSKDIRVFPRASRSIDRRRTDINTSSRAKRNGSIEKDRKRNETKIREARRRKWHVGRDQEEEEGEEEKEEEKRNGENRYARHTGTSQPASLSGEGRDATSASTRVPGANADDSSFLASVGYFRPATIFEGDSSRGFAAVLVRVCARWPAQRRRPPHLCRETRRQRSRFAGIWDPRTAKQFFILYSSRFRTKFDRENLWSNERRETILIWNGLDSTIQGSHWSQCEVRTTILVVPGLIRNLWLLISMILKRSEWSKFHERISLIWWY